MLDVSMDFSTYVRKQLWQVKKVGYCHIDIEHENHKVINKRYLLKSKCEK